MHPGDQSSDPHRRGGERLRAPSGARARHRLVLDRWPRRVHGGEQWHVSGDIPHIVEAQAPRRSDGLQGAHRSSSQGRAPPVLRRPVGVPVHLRLRPSPRGGWGSPCSTARPPAPGSTPSARPETSRAHRHNHTFQKKDHDAQRSQFSPSSASFSAPIVASCGKSAAPSRTGGRQPRGRDQAPRDLLAVSRPASGAVIETMQAIADEYAEEHPGFQLTLITTPDRPSYIQKYETLAAANKLPERAVLRPAVRAEAGLAEQDGQRGRPARPLRDHGPVPSPLSTTSASTTARST